jgi:hypothetical protein
MIRQGCRIIQCRAVTKKNEEIGEKKGMEDKNSTIFQGKMGLRGRP